MYAVWIKINETLPWIELEKEHQTRIEAANEAKKALNHVSIKIVKVQRKTKRVKVLVTAR